MKCACGVLLLSVQLLGGEFSHQGQLACVSCEEHITKDMNTLDMAADSRMVSIGALRRAVMIISLVNSLVSADYGRTSVGKMDSRTRGLSVLIPTVAQ